MNDPLLGFSYSFPVIFPRFGVPPLNVQDGDDQPRVHLRVLVAAILRHQAHIRGPARGQKGVAALAALRCQAMWDYLEVDNPLMETMLNSGEY